MSYFSRPYRRFFFITGNTDDEFCPPALSLMTLEEMLFWHLKEIGYDRQVYYDGRRKIYFHDLQSKQLCRSSDSPQASPSQKPLHRSTKMCAGPLGQRIIRRSNSPSSSAPVQTSDESLLFPRMPDADMPGTLNRFMMQESPKTAVIFRDGFDFLSHLDHDAQRSMRSVLYNWGHLLSTNRNICIFILPGSDFAQLRQKMERHEWDFLLNKCFVRDHIPSPQVISIASPRQDEIANLINYWRIKKGLIIDWRKFSTQIGQLTRYWCAAGKKLMELNDQVQQCTQFDDAALSRITGQGEQTSAWDRLRKMHGMGTVIEKIERLIARHQENQKSQPEDDSRQTFNTVSRLLPPVRRCGESINLHIALKGNPGTGKTTVARLIAEIYRDMGLLETGHLVKVSREDLVAGYVGQTAIRTAQKISEAMGGVLFVDEAYRLSEGGSNDFGQEAIETIMEAMSNHKGEFAVIAAGYPQRIEAFLDANPGLRRRFSEINTITIPDYDPKTLLAIFEQYVESQKRQIHPDLKARLPDFFQNWYRRRNPETFGNAGEVVDHLYPAMEERRIERVRKQTDESPRFVLISDDIPEHLQEYLKPAQPDDPDAILNSLDHLIGLKTVKQQVRNFINAIKLQKRRGQTAVLCPGHYVFVGNPGTGKTTVARIMGEIFYALGILQKGHLVETGRADLVAGFVGQTALKTKAVLERSLDGVLFIDEAYQLVMDDRDTFGKEALETLVAFMENNRHRLCIIAAGYPEPMDRFLNSNPGLPSRFSGTIEFENYSASEMLAIFKIMAEQRKLIMEPGLDQALLPIFEHWENLRSPTFGNGREVRKLLDAMIVCMNNRLAEQPHVEGEMLFTLKIEDIPANIHPSTQSSGN